LSNLTPATYIGNAAAQAKRIRETLAGLDGVAILYRTKNPQPLAKTSD